MTPQQAEILAGLASLILYATKEAQTDARVELTELYRRFVAKWEVGR